ncbi:hypothetical protein [Allokutzneria albata]|uniref:Uncharacterized protein n=1 Tax=Allokutzneria albata TaxID=211114 RepID=A0A1H0CQY0_ALLAB|nr:hypothetical protein [Allokutzneria albata]SDN60337.1 hypothetical protein SAMN04489726_7373 [Allokutzneria albata]
MDQLQAFVLVRALTQAAEQRSERRTHHSVKPRRRLLRRRNR